MTGSRYACLIPMALFLVLSLSALGETDMWGSDEARYAQAAREMMASGDYIDLTVNGEAYTKKPPGLMWGQVLAARVTGELREFEARVPSALGGTGCVLLVWFMGSVLFGRREAFWGALLLAVTPYFLKESRMGRMDILVAVFTCLSYTGFVLWERRRAASWITFLLFFLPMAAGILAKWTGPLFVLPSVLLYLVLTGQIRRIPILPSIAGLAIAVAPLFIFGDFGEFGKVMGGQVHQRAFHHHLVRLPALAMPLTLFIPGLIVHVRRQKITTPDRRGLGLLASWVLLNVLILSFSSGKRSNYLDPLFPPIALAVGFYMARAVGASTKPDRLFRVPFAILAVLVLAGGAALAVRPGLVGAGGALALSPTAIRVGGAVFCAAGLALLAINWKGRASWAPAGLTAVLAAGLLAQFAVVNPALNHSESVRPITDVFHERSAPDSLLASSSLATDKPNPKWMFYGGLGTAGVMGSEESLAWLTGPGERFLLVKQKDYGRFLDAAGGSLPVGLRVEVDSRWPETRFLLLSNREGPGETVRFGPTDPDQGLLE